MKFVQSIYKDSEPSCGKNVEFFGCLSPGEIREFRKFLGLTQVDAAKICGGGPNAFSRYESGKTKPSAATCNFLLLLKELAKDGRPLLRYVGELRGDC